MWRHVPEGSSTHETAVLLYADQFSATLCSSFLELEHARASKLVDAGAGVRGERARGSE
jgi:hypothetical protein